MSRTFTTMNRAVAAVLRQQGDLITRSQALAAGLTNAALRHRLRADGPWMVVLPGIYLARNGPLTVGQREVAAMLYAGRGCVITGPAALRRQGVRVPLSDIVDVLIPEATKRRSHGFVQIHRTRKLPEHPWVIEGIRYAPPARAVADAANFLEDLRSVSALVASAVQQRICSVPDLVAELRAGPKQGSGALRAALAEVADGIASVAEGDLRRLIKRNGLPEPMYNPRLYLGAEFIAQPDAWWPDAGVACEVDSREWHLSPEDWEKTMVRHAKMSAHGIIVLHVSPRRLRAGSAEVASQLRSALDNGQQRMPLPIRAVPSR